ncbi:HAD-IIIA family hydrolase [Gluconobacter cerevisiae]|nr:HAD-IIIA family hydrolase [Gluconobacter cerevisiae]
MYSVTVRQCVILLEDTATRGLPLSLTLRGDKPFLAWLMREMQRFGVEEFVFLTSRISQDIATGIENIGGFLPRAAKISISVAPYEVGTGGALRHAQPYLQKRFFLCSANTLFSCNLARFLTVARKGHWMLLRPADPHAHPRDVQVKTRCTTGGSVSPYNDIEPTVQQLINAGLYLFDAQICEVLTEICSLEADVLPKLVENQNLQRFSLTGDFYSAENASTLEKILGEMSVRLRRPAVFLDRDGVINRDLGWVGTRERFEWEPGAREAIARFCDSGHHVFIVTNQSGIARGFYSENDLMTLMDWVVNSIREYGGTIDDWRYCPMHPESAIEQYRGHSVNRKPEPGMILDLLQRWELDPMCCVLFGDQPTDMQAARAAGVQGIMIGPESLSGFVPKLNISLCENELFERSRHGMGR